MVHVRVKGTVHSSLRVSIINLQVVRDIIIDLLIRGVGRAAVLGVDRARWTQLEVRAGLHRSMTSLLLLLHIVN